MNKNGVMYSKIPCDKCGGKMEVVEFDKEYKKEYCVVCSNSR